jgi:hypothetical protein
MRRIFLMLHGLPGAGKTALCAELSRQIPTVYYVNMAAHPDFRRRAMSDICAADYLAHASSSSLLTEAWTPKVSARDKFVAEVGELIRRRGAIEFEYTQIVYLEENDDTVLAARRNRSAEEYARLRHEIQSGSDQFHYRIFPAVTGETVKERAQRLWGWLGR